MRMIKVYPVTNIKQTSNQGYKVAVDADMAASQTGSMPVYQHYGFSSMPLSGSELVVISDGNNMASVAEDHSGRPPLSPGDVMLYIDDEHYIKIAANGVIIIEAGAQAIEIYNNEGGIVLGEDGTVDINGGNLTVEP